MSVMLPRGLAGRAVLEADLALRVAPRPSEQPGAVGAEVELIPFDSDTLQRSALFGDARAIVSLLRRFGADRCWREQRTDKGTPCFLLPSGGTITFEPGGQIEYSAPPARAATALLAHLRATIEPLRAFARAEGVTLVAAGIDPHHGLDGAPMQLHAERYERMAAYFATIGDAGARMMRQTASVQVCVELGSDPPSRWRLLEALTPYLVAIFANSSRYAGTDSGYRSFRAEGWRMLDPSRTGLAGDTRAYLAFALGAPDIMRRTPDGYAPFAEWLDAGRATLADWHHHLTTLFPEVRPRGYFEVRSIDAIDPDWYAAPLALVCGVAYDARAAAAAADLLGAPDATLLRRAGIDGLGDPVIASRAADLVTIALDGCRSLGAAFFAPAELERARAFFDRFTRRGRAPSDTTVRPGRINAPAMRSETPARP